MTKPNVNIKKTLLTLILGIFYMIVSLPAFSDLTTDDKYYKVTKHIPKYPNSSDWTVENRFASLTGTLPGANLTFITSDPPESIYRFYKTSLPDSGWEWSGYMPESETKSIMDLKYRKLINGTSFEISIISAGYIGNSDSEKSTIFISESYGKK